MKNDIKMSQTKLAPSCEYYDQDNSVLAAIQKAISKIDRFPNYIIDIGCGEGRYINEVLIPSSIYIGVDLSYRSLSRFKKLKNANSCNFLQADASGSLPLKRFSDKNCLLYLGFSLHLIGGLNRLPKIVDQLKPKSLLVIQNCRTTYNSDLVHYLVPRLVKVDLDRTPTIEELVRVAKLCGFNDVESFQSSYTEDTSEEKLDLMYKKINNRYCSGLQLLDKKSIEQGLKRLEKLRETNGNHHLFKRSIVGVICVSQ